MMNVDPNALAALDSFAEEPIPAAPVAGPPPGEPYPVTCGVCGSLVDTVTGEPIETGMVEDL